MASKHLHIHFQINNFYVDRYHPFKGCYLHELTATRIGNLISENLYVLRDDNGKPLAVIEANKTAVDAETGHHQAKHYADGMHNWN